jgi:hypothetical protein
MNNSSIFVFCSSSSGHFKLLKNLLRPDCGHLKPRLQQLQDVQFFHKQSSVTASVVHQLDSVWSRTASTSSTEIFSTLVSDMTAELIADLQNKTTFLAQQPIDKIKDAINNINAQQWKLWSSPVDMNILADFHGTITHIRVRLCASNLCLWPQLCADIVATTFVSAFSLTETTARYLEAGLHSLSIFEASPSDYDKIIKQLSIFVQNQKTKAVVIDIPKHLYEH